MFLALTSQTEFWDTGDEIVFAGPWCTRYERRGEWEALHGRTIPDPWEDIERFRRAVSYCDEAVERLLPPIARHLNRVLSVQKSTRYWRILLGRWLAYHVQQFYLHHAIIEDAYGSHPDLKTVLLDAASYRVPADTADFIQLSMKETYHLQIFSHILSARGGNFPRRKAAPEDARPVIRYPRRRAVASIKRAVSRLIASLVPPGLGDVLVADLNLSRDERRRLFLGSRLKALPYLAELPEDLKFDPAWNEAREGLALIAEGRDEFERILISGLPQFLPTLYLEGYRAARDFSLARLWRTPRVVFSAIGWYGNEAFKFAAAECAERGSLLWGIQHGGFYGLSERAEGEAFERSILDRFYAWGWAALAKDPKVKDLPHPQLRRAGDASPGDEVLFVPIAMLLHLVGVDRGAAGPKLGPDYIERQARFLRALPKRLADKTAVRVFVEFGWRHKERLKDLYSDLRLDDTAKPFPERLRKARIAVFDCPMTTMLEALAADVPFVLTWNPGSWTIRPEARDLVERLRKAGILFDEPEAAARQVARVYDDPRAWWDSPGVREARGAFAEKFALARADWLELWLNEIRTS